MADLLRQILRVNGFVARFRQIVQPFTRIAIVLSALSRNLRSVFLPAAAAGRQGGFDIAHQRHIDLAVRANAAGLISI
jgi:hypothetical protein